MVSFDVKAGCFPQEDNWEGVVLNQVVPDAQRYLIGDEIVLSVGGKDRALVVVGKVEEVGTGAVAYVSRKTFLDMVAPDHRTTLLRVAKTREAALTAAMSVANRVLDDKRAPVNAVSPLAVFKNAVTAHFEILIRSLLMLATLAAFVGMMGLSSALSANVVEGTRELAVLRAVGATGRQIRSLVLGEALLVCSVSFLLAAVLGTALSERIGQFIGMMSFRLPLPLSPQWTALVALFFGLLGLGLLASYAPAQRASRLTINRALRVL